MLKKMLFTLVRVLFMALSIAFLAPLVPGVTFGGSAMAAAGLGVSLWLTFLGVQRAAFHFEGIQKGTCPLPATMRRMTLYFIVATAAFLGAVTLVAPGVFAVSGVFSALGASLVVFLGTVASNIVTFPFTRSSQTED